MSIIDSKSEVPVDVPLAVTAVLAVATMGQPSEAPGPDNNGVLDLDVCY